MEVERRVVSMRVLGIFKTQKKNGYAYAYMKAYLGSDEFVGAAICRFYDRHPSAIVVEENIHGMIFDVEGTKVFYTEEVIG